MATRDTIHADQRMLDDSLINDLAGNLRGPVLRSGTPAYDEARSLWNGLIDRRPALIVQPTGTADVVEAVNFAREQNLVLSIKGGGHNVAGNAVNDGGLVIDLSRMRGVYVDPRTKTVRAKGGATWGDVDRESQLFGLVVPGGVVSTTGIAGLTLHGGLGHVCRKYGLSIDNLLEVEIVTADGQVRIANDVENPDLFWAVRGAGSNFGVVTQFVFRAHPVGPMVHLCAPFYPLAEGERVLKAWRDFVANAPDEIHGIGLAWSVPDAEEFPPELRAQPVVIPTVVYAGDLEEGARMTQPLQELGTPLLDLSGPIPWTVLQAAFDPFFPAGRLAYWKSIYVDNFSDEAIAIAIDRAAKRPSSMSAVTIWHLGGAIARVPENATAFGRRAAPFAVSAEATWTDPAKNDANIAWSRDTVEAFRPFSQGGSYLNFPGFGEERAAMVRAAYGSNYERLAQLKAKYDPTNLFRMNQNIEPAMK